MKTAIVYDWIDKQGGIERMLQVIAKLFPEADFFTSVYNSSTAPWAASLKVKTSFMQVLPDFIKQNRVISSQLYPFAFESFDFSSYDRVISVTSSFAKGIITRPETQHICILLTPTRYIWDMKGEYKRSPLFNALAAPFLSALRKWDFVSAQRPDTIYAISNLVAERCQKIYKRNAEVLYPPFNLEYWQSLPLKEIKIENYFLVVARLEPYKRIELVIEACKKQNSECVIVGNGSELNRLQSLANKNIHFLTEVSDNELAYLYTHAKALIMPQEEDFGYTALEALYFNCPVISYRHSGTAEIIEENKTGLFFDEQSVESLLRALERFASVPYNVKSAKEEILKRFSLAAFADKIKTWKK